MLGLGTQELIVLLILGGGLAGVVLLVLFLFRRGGGRVAELEANNRRLRDELDRARGRPSPGG